MMCIIKVRSCYCFSVYISPHCDSVVGKHSVVGKQNIMQFRYDVKSNLPFALVEFLIAALILALSTYTLSSFPEWKVVRFTVAGVYCICFSLLRTRLHGSSSHNTYARSSNPNALVTHALSSRNLSTGRSSSPYGSLSRSMFQVVLLSVASVLEADTVTSNRVTRSIPLSRFQSSNGFYLR